MAVRIKFRSLAKVTLCAALLLTAISPVGLAQTMSVQEIARRALNSTMVLIAEDAEGNPVTLGSGFFISPNVIVTNFHVLKGASRVEGRQVGEQQVIQIRGFVAADRENDLVLLEVDFNSSFQLPLANSAGVSVGDKVYAVGNPETLEGTFSDGIVSAVRGSALIQITAPISHGSSGGPILNSRGEVIGVAQFYIQDGQNLNFAISSNLVQRLQLNQIGAARRITELSEVPVLTAAAPSPQPATSQRSNPKFRPSPFPKTAFDREAPICSDTVVPNEVWKIKNKYKQLLQAGDRYAEAHNVKLAMAVYYRAASVNPSAPAFYKLSHAYLEGKCYARAEEAARNAVLAEPESDLYKSNLAELTKRLELYDRRMNPTLDDILSGETPSEDSKRKSGEP